MRWYLELLLVILFPYSVIAALICIYKGYFMEIVFHNDIFSVLLFLLILYTAALVCSVAVLIIWVGSFLIYTNAKKSKTFCTKSHSHKQNNQESARIVY